eukprot:m.185783 g.185783  ORF g.185783 m.185783 type:complete len:445 (-) comp16688_c5_seq1:381-1715(-)
MTDEERGQRMLAHIDGLAAHNIPAKLATSEPKEVRIAYQSGLKMVHQKQGSEVCEMLCVDPRKGLNVSFAVQRLSKYGQNLPSPVEEKIYGTEMNVEQRYKRAYTVIRGGDITTVKSKDIVVGDIIYLEAGDHVPADIRVLKASKDTQELQQFSPEAQQHQTTTAQVSTVIDNTLPGGFGPAPVASGASTQMKIEQANNVALKGSTVLTGSLVGVVFATGARCALSGIKQSLFLPPAAQRLPRGVDKKKVAKLAAKLGTLGASVKQPDRIVPLCSMKNCTVLIPVSQANLIQVNNAIKRVIAQGFRLLVFLRPDVDAERDILPLQSVAIGRQYNRSKVYKLTSSAAIDEATRALQSESAVFTTGPEMATADLVKVVLDVYQEPVVVFSNDVQDKVAVERATLSFSTFDACPAILASTDVVCELDGLERLSLYLKILRESTEISS